MLLGHKPILRNSIYESASNATYPDYVRMLQHRLKYIRVKAIDYIHHRISKEMIIILDQLVTMLVTTFI